jgi:predicted lysophospholipase L1 biosynthesis ABC-type transport system permease subunit
VSLEASGTRSAQELVVVGVARDSRWRSIAGAADPFMYQPFAQFRARGTRGVYMMKSALPSARVGAIANAIASRAATSVPLSIPRPLATGIDRELSRERTFAWMLSLLAILGFTLAALGLYGLIAQTTLERQREFGIRLALGAAGGSLVRLVARHVIVVFALGVVIGLGLSYFGTRVIQNMLFGVSRLDPAVYLAAIVTLLIVVALASVAPIVKTLRVQAVELLRTT